MVARRAFLGFLVGASVLGWWWRRKEPPRSPVIEDRGWVLLASDLEPDQPAEE